MSATLWSILPPIVAIVLALITKEVYSSMMIGILSGALLFTNFHLVKTVETTFQIMGDEIGGNSDILIFLVLLGMIISMIDNLYEDISGLIEKKKNSVSTLVQRF